MFSNSIWNTVSNWYKNLNFFDKFLQQLKRGNKLHVPANYVKHVRCLL